MKTFDDLTGGKKSKDREVIGDELGPPKDDGLSFTDDIYVGFGSLFQGDRLGVEFALSSHECLLKEGAYTILKDPPRRTSLPRESSRQLGPKLIQERAVPTLGLLWLPPL